MTTDIFAQGDKTRERREKQAAYEAKPKCGCGRVSTAPGGLCWTCQDRIDEADARASTLRDARAAIVSAITDMMNYPVDDRYAQADAIADAIDAYIDVKLGQSK